MTPAVHVFTQLAGEKELFGWLHRIVQANARSHPLFNVKVPSTNVEAEYLIGGRCSFPIVVRQDWPNSLFGSPWKLARPLRSAQH